MRVMVLVKESDQSEAGVLPDTKILTEMGKFIEQMSKAGILIATGGLDPRATQIKSANGKVTFTDGPFTEAKEAIVGFALIEAPSKEQAIEYSKQFWKIVGDGEGEIYSVFGPRDGIPGQ